jgi:UbiD family decarboxylase
MGKPYPVIKGRRDFRFANAEIVLEGFVDPKKRRKEGPSVSDGTMP